jgi:single-strand DNA-binding protein
MFNKAILIGNLTRDPEVRYSPQGTTVCNFGIASNRKYKSGEEMKEDVLFINIVVFGKQADSCSQYLNKGSQVLVEGRLQQSNWETDGGEKRSKIEVVGENIKFLSKSSNPKPEETTDIQPF